jgi:hypothetical protein
MDVSILGWIFTATEVGWGPISFVTNEMPPSMHVNR